MNNVRGNSKLQLYLSLFNEALQEDRIEFRYFRLWNLLETIARSKGFIGTPLRDWQGNIVHNRAGQDRSIQDDAVELVTELIRQTLSIAGMSEQSFSTGLQQGLISEQISIWYRHRNCVVHSGGCIPDNQQHCDRVKDKYIKCKMAHHEIVASHGSRDIFNDQYLHNLRDLVSLLIGHELN